MTAKKRKCLPDGRMAGQAEMRVEQGLVLVLAELSASDVILQA